MKSMNGRTSPQHPESGVCLSVSVWNPDCKLSAHIHTLIARSWHTVSPHHPHDFSPLAHALPSCFHRPTALVRSGSTWVPRLHCTPQTSVPHHGALAGSGVLRKNKQTSKVPPEPDSSISSSEPRGKQKILIQLRSKPRNVSQSRPRPTLLPERQPQPHEIISECKQECDRCATPRARPRAARSTNPHHSATTYAPRPYPYTPRTKPVNTPEPQQAPATSLGGRPRSKTMHVWICLRWPFGPRHLKTCQSLPKKPKRTEA